MTWTTLRRSRLNDDMNGWQGGSGPELLMIHGVGMHADYWSNLVPELVSHFSVTIIDMPGHGDSPVFSENRPTLASYTDCIAQLILQNSVSTLIVGHSMGAMIAIDLAVRYPNYVTAVVALNAVYQRNEAAKAAVRSRATSLAEVAELDTNSTLERWFGHEPDGLHALALNACTKWLSEANQIGYRQAYRAFAHHDGPDENNLHQIQCPALYITGENEPNSTPTMSKALASTTEQGECHIVKGARHMMSMTHGNDVLKRFVPFLLQHAVYS